jgi:hypothetical protein
MNFRKLLSLGSQTAPKVIDDLVDPTKALVKKGAMEADEIVGEATKKANPIDDIVDAELSQKAVKERMDPRLAALLGGAGIGGAAMMMGGGDEPPVDIPMAKTMESPKEEFPFDMMDAGAQAEALSMPQEAPVKPKTGLQDPGLRAASDALDKGMASLPKESPETQDVMDELSLLQSAQERDAQDRFMAGLLRAGTTVGGALAMTKPDYSGVDAIEKNVGINEKNVKSQVATKGDTQKLEKARLDIDDENKLRDPKSDISKTVRTLAGKLGISTTEATSAKQLQDAGLPLGTLLSTQIAADSRRDMFQLQREQMAANKESQKKTKTQESVDKLVSQAQKSKDFEAYNASKDAINSLDAAIESGDKTASGTAFMQFAKIAQGDNSVVRDGDMAVLAGRFNYTSPTEMITKLAARAKGGNFNEQELLQMKTVAERARQIKGERVQRLLSPAILRAQEAGLNLAESIDPAVVEEFASIRAPQAEQKQSVKLGSQKKPGSIITTKSGKTYRVNADGLTATEQ